MIVENLQGVHTHTDRCGIRVMGSGERVLANTVKDEQVCRIPLNGIPR